MVKSGKFPVHQWYLISFAENEEEDEVSGAASNMTMAVWHCWMLSDFHFFKVVTAVWLLPPDTEVICYPTAKPAWSQWGKNEFCDLPFTFCPSVAGLHLHKETFMGPPFPSPGSYMANPQQSYLSVCLPVNTTWPTYHQKHYLHRAQSSDHLTGVLLGWAISSTAYVVWIYLCPNVCLTITEFF